MAAENYFSSKNENNILKLRIMLQTLPDFCGEFFRGIEPYTTSLTRLSYARDLKIFFYFLTSEISQFSKISIENFSLNELDKITSTHLEMFLEYLNIYKVNGKIVKNGEKARSRKLSSVRTLLKYFFKKDKLTSNIAEKIDTPKIHQSPIIRLEIDEMVNLLNISQNGNNLTTMQKGFHKHTKVRDFAILSLFLGTGIRISECVGLNVQDIDFTQNSFKVTRKGGNSEILYFNDEVANALKTYLIERSNNSKVEANEKALFLSLQNKRISVRAVEKMVKKYSLLVTPLKNITPHKLRSTFGTNLYRETNDIYVVADVLGHKDINTTRKHYAAISEDIRRNAINKITLREEK